MKSYVELQMVAEFHAKIGVKEPKDLSCPPEPIRMLYYGLLLEEMAELSRALSHGDKLHILDALIDTEYMIDGVMRLCGITSKIVSIEGYTPHQTADELLFINIYTNLMWLMEAIAYGRIGLVPAWFQMFNRNLYHIFMNHDLLKVHDAAFDEVHRSNMSKDCDREYGGKVIKGSSYTPPNWSKIMKLL